jgi:hypothetical protein
MPPNPFSENLQAQLRRFLAQEALFLSSEGRSQMQSLCDKAALAAKTPSDRSRAKRRWALLYMQTAIAAQQRSSNELDDSDFQLALKTLCPLWPFC